MSHLYLPDGYGYNLHVPELKTESEKLIEKLKNCMNCKYQDRDYNGAICCDRAYSIQVDGNCYRGPHENTAKDYWELEE